MRVVRLPTSVPLSRVSILSVPSVPHSVVGWLTQSLILYSGAIVTSY